MLRGATRDREAPRNSCSSIRHHLRPKEPSRFAAPISGKRWAMEQGQVTGAVASVGESGSQLPRNKARRKPRRLKSPTVLFFSFWVSPIGLDSTEAGEQGCPSDRVWGTEQGADSWSMGLGEYPAHIQAWKWGMINKTDTTWHICDQRESKLNDFLFPTFLLSSLYQETRLPPTPPELCDFAELFVLYILLCWNATRWILRRMHRSPGTQNKQKQPSSCHCPGITLPFTSSIKNSLKVILLLLVRYPV